LNFDGVNILKKAEGRGQKAEGEAEGRGQKAEGRIFRNLHFSMPDCVAKFLRNRKFFKKWQCEILNC